MSTSFEYPLEIQKIIYTANIIEVLNRQSRQIAKNKPSFTNDDPLDELYIWLSNVTTIQYIRNTLERGREKGSSLILAGQDQENFDVEDIRELTRPLFAIPTHQFLSNARSMDKRSYMDGLQLEGSEPEPIRCPQRGVCLYKCASERYLLEVHAPPYKEKLFGKAGGRRPGQR